jgi:hypothetical protein
MVSVAVEPQTEDDAAPIAPATFSGLVETLHTLLGTSKIPQGIT